MAELIDKGTEHERIVCRVRITGTFKGVPFQYEDTEGAEGSQYVWTKDSDPSTFWWAEGNFSCDCNRHKFLPNWAQKEHNGECGNEIKIDTIAPLETWQGLELPTLYLNETENERN